MFHYQLINKETGELFLDSRKTKVTGTDDNYFGNADFNGVMHDSRCDFFIGNLSEYDPNDYAVRLIDNDGKFLDEGGNIVEHPVYFSAELGDSHKPIHLDLQTA